MANGRLTRAAGGALVGHPMQDLVAGQLAEPGPEGRQGVEGLLLLGGGDGGVPQRARATPGRDPGRDG